MQKIFYVFLASIQYLIFFCKNEKLPKNVANPNQGIIENGSNPEIVNAYEENPWEQFMDKFNIEKNHGSGIKIDLGNVTTVDNKVYRIPTGKCPVFGKGITIINSDTNFLKPINLNDKPLKLGGLAFPSNFNLSPLDKKKLKEYFSQENINLDDGIGMCSFHISQISLHNDQSSDYRYPGVYDNDNNLCYVLYVSAQQNLGPRYCNQDSTDNNSIFCFKPEKKRAYDNFVYLTKYLHRDWNEKCPHFNIESSKFGLWKNGKCHEINEFISVESNTFRDCNTTIFDLSASDQPKQYEEELADNEKLVKGLERNDFDMIGSVFIPEGAIRNDKYKSKGKGYNWGNYNKKTKKCTIFKTAPTCLINDADYISTTALSHPTALEKFPCHIYLKEIENQIKSADQNKEGSDQQKQKLIIPPNFISLDKDSLKCPCEPKEIDNYSCKFYVCKCLEKINEEIDKKTKSSNLLVIIAIVAVSLVVLGSCFYIYYNKTKNEADKYNKMDQVGYYGKSTSRADEMLNPEASFWGEDKRASQTTPVLMEKPYY